MPNIRLTLEYDGTSYHGWQRQPRQVTIQGTLERAIQQICGEKVNVIGAGRTDAGVHAAGQVANFKTCSPLSGDTWPRALNRYLPDEISVLYADRVPDRFHSRYDAIEKTYEYRILNRRIRPAIGRQYQWVVYPPLQLAPMRRAAQWLRGRHDFSSFRAGGEKKGRKSNDCTLRELRVSRSGDEIRILFRGDRFLYQMVRTIVGTLVEVGKRKRHPSEVAKILALKNREKAGQTAPAHGLFLLKVHYHR